MDFKFWEILLAKPFVAAIFAQLSSQVFKIFLPLFEGKPPDIKRFLNYGDIPSAHTAFIVGVTVCIGLQEGWRSPILALAVVVAGILIYDIIKMRKTVELNLKMTIRLMEANRLPLEKDLPQFKGHSLLEVIVGGLWGAGCAIVVMLVMK